ncbi:MAG: hypothetical protein ACTSPY_04020 [Candidatus Helarchaeota archaeon]
MIEEKEEEISSIDYTRSRVIYISISAIFVTIYAILSMIIFPTPFIGGSGTLNLGLIGTPIIGCLTANWLFQFVDNWKEKLGITIFIAFACGLVSSFISPENFCGLWFITLPFMGIIGTIFTYQGGKVAIISTIWISTMTIIMWFKYSLIIINIPHLIAIVCGVVAIFNIPKRIKNERVRIITKILLACIVGTIAEWCALNIYAAFILNLPLPAWYGIMPLVYIERSFGAIGGFLISIGIIGTLSKIKF